MIADSQVTTQSVYFNSDGDGSEYVLQGRSTALRVSNQMRSASGYKNGTLRIVMPECGFAATPIVRENPIGDNPFGWHEEWDAHPVDGWQFTLVVDPSSPGLKSPTGFSQTLVDWSAGGCGIKKSNLPLAPLARPRANRLAYGDDTDLPLTLAFEHQSRGFVIHVR